MSRGKHTRDEVASPEGPRRPQSEGGELRQMRQYDLLPPSANVPAGHVEQ